MVEGIATGRAPAVTGRPLYAERPIRVVLLQIRSMPEAKRHEAWCVRRCTGLSPEQLFPWNVVDRPELPWERLRHADAILIGGSGDHSVTKEYPFMAWLETTVRRAVDDAKPLFGICWGHHLLARALGGRVITDPSREEVGTFGVSLTAAGREDPLFDGLPVRFSANLVHHDTVVELPAGFRELAISDACRFQAMRLDELPIYGTQFHSEMNLSQLRKRLLMYQGEYLKTEEQAEEVVERMRPTDQTYGLLRRFLELYT